MSRYFHNTSTLGKKRSHQVSQALVSVEVMVGQLLIMLAIRLLLLVEVNKSLEVSECWEIKPRFKKSLLNFQLTVQLEFNLDFIKLIHGITNHSFYL